MEQVSKETIESINFINLFNALDIITEETEFVYLKTNRDTYYKWDKETFLDRFKWRLNEYNNRTDCSTDLNLGYTIKFAGLPIFENNKFMIIIEEINGCYLESNLIEIGII